LPKTVFEVVGTYECQSELAGDHMVKKTAVTYKCQKRFVMRLGTYECQSELAGDQKLKKITFESQSRKLARKLSQADAVCWGCSMGVPIGGKTAQLLCGGGIAASRQCQIWPKKCCGAVALYGDRKNGGYL
jgi:hypothetical protein